MPYRRILVDTDHKSYVRDVNSRALLAKDKVAAEDYKTKSKMLNGVAELREEINILRTDIEEIKEMLSKLANPYKVV